MRYLQDMKLDYLTRTANLISLTRIIFVLPIIVAYPNRIFMMVLFCVAAASDYFDGYFARKEGPTKFGKVLDPLCDKIFFLSLAIFFLVVHEINTFQFIVLLLRDFYLFALMVMTAIISLYDRRVLALKGILNPRWPGKMTTVIVFACLAYVMMGLPAFEYVVFIPLLSAVISIIDYTVIFGSKLSEVI